MVEHHAVTTATLAGWEFSNAIKRAKLEKGASWLPGLANFEGINRLYRCYLTPRRDGATAEEQ
jgi:hypothetical protein